MSNYNRYLRKMTFDKVRYGSQRKGFGKTLRDRRRLLESV